jgi:hypothetical protein
MNDWVEVASGPDLATARRNFRDWLLSKGLNEHEVDPNAIRIDTIRGEFSDRRRIMVKQEIVDQISH